MGNTGSRSRQLYSIIKAFGIKKWPQDIEAISP